MFFLLATSEEKDTLENIKNRYKQWHDEKQSIAIDPLQSLLLESYKSVGLLSPHYMKWPQEYKSYLSTKNFKLPKGRPKDLIFKAIQIIVYRLLEKNSSEKQKTIEKLTAEIINSAYRDHYKTKSLPILKARDINNALHHS